MLDLMTAIQNLTPNAECIVRGNSEIEWLDSRPQPTDVEIQTEVTRQPSLRKKSQTRIRQT